MTTEQTIVAVYDNPVDADAAVRDLEAAHVPSHAISRHEGHTGTTTAAAEPVREEGFWARLFGSEPDHDTSVYDRSIERGSSVLTVRVPEEQVDHVSSILGTHNPVDLDERSAQYLNPEASAMSPAATSPVASASPVLDGAPTSAAAVSENDTLKLAEEKLAVGKRAIGGTTTRIRRFVVQTPVEERVNLRNETVTLERRPITDGQPVETADFTDKVIEMTEMGEEAVVSKTARVVEEVNLRKDVTEHVETVKDTLRRDQVEIEKVPGETRGDRVASSAPLTPASKI